MANKDVQKDKQPQAGQRQQDMPDGRKNEEEVGEPVQLPEDKSQKQGGGTANR